MCGHGEFTVHNTYCRRRYEEEVKKKFFDSEKRKMGTGTNGLFTVGRYICVQYICEEWEISKSTLHVPTRTY